MNDEYRAWALLILGAIVFIAAVFAPERHDLATDALILLATSAIYGGRCKP